MSLTGWPVFRQIPDFEMISQLQLLCEYGDYEENEPSAPGPAESALLDSTPMCIDLTDSPSVRVESPETEPSASGPAEPAPSPLARPEVPETESSAPGPAEPALTRPEVNFQNLTSRLFAQHRRRLFGMHRYLREGATYLRRLVRTVKRDKHERRLVVKRRFPPLAEAEAHCGCGPDRVYRKLIRAQKRLLMEDEEPYQESAMERQWLLTLQ